MSELKNYEKRNIISWMTTGGDAQSMVDGMVSRDCVTRDDVESFIFECREVLQDWVGKK